jgi:hypothetical protein
MVYSPPEDDLSAFSLTQDTANVINTAYNNLRLNARLILNNSDLTTGVGTGSLIAWTQLGTNTNAHGAYFGARTTGNSAGDNEFVWIQQYTSNNTFRQTLSLDDSGLLTGNNFRVTGNYQIRFTDGTGQPRLCIDFFSDYDPVSPGISNYSVAQVRTTHGNGFNNPEYDIFVDDGSQSNLVRRFRIQKNGSTTIAGNLAVQGALSKTSGSFRIDHPLESKKDTHDLVHSFVEGPQADNIYRGQVTLINGNATINLDDAADMTEGTFILLNTNISCFTSNETDWTAVRGSVSENILTIEAQDNTSTATVSWLVIGERHDQHMLDTDWTDKNGRVITEPLKILQD